MVNNQTLKKSIGKYHLPHIYGPRSLEMSRPQIYELMQHHSSFIHTDSAFYFYVWVVNTNAAIYTILNSCILEHFPMSVKKPF